MKENIKLWAVKKVGQFGLASKKLCSKIDDLDARKCYQFGHLKIGKLGNFSEKTGQVERKGGNCMVATIKGFVADD